MSEELVVVKEDLPLKLCVSSLQGLELVLEDVHIIPVDLSQVEGENLDLQMELLHLPPWANEGGNRVFLLLNPLFELVEVSSIKIRLPYHVLLQSCSILGI